MFATMKREKPKMITLKEYAKKHDVAYTTVLFWHNKGVLPGVEKQEIPFAPGFIYFVAETTPKPELRPGPKPKAKKK